MIEFSLQGKKRKNLILFVHGLTGDNMTWVNQSGQSFADLLSLDKDVTKKCDIAHFTYYSKLITSTIGKAALSFVSKVFSNGAKKIKLNLDVNDISDLLLTELKVKCSCYDSVIIVAHSLGGLVTKSAIMKAFKDDKVPKVKVFISLAVPHDGAHLALIAKHLNSNIQLENLTPLSENIKNLNTQWIRTPGEQLPKTIYFQGKYDMIVSNTSSVGYQQDMQEVIFLEEDHSSIAKPSSVKSTLFMAVLQILKDFMNNVDVADALRIKKLSNEDTYNDEIFVLKLMIADVHNKNISSAKNSFYNAEFIKKIIIAKKIISLEDFQQLYNLIEGMYNVAFGLLTSGRLKDANELVAHIHEKIQNEDQNILKSISALSFIHKTGMLHQLANDIENNIWWSDGHNMTTIDSYKQSKP